MKYKKIICIIVNVTLLYYCCQRFDRVRTGTFCRFVLETSTEYTISLLLWSSTACGSILSYPKTAEYYDDDRYAER